MKTQKNNHLFVNALNHSPLATAIYDSNTLNIAFANLQMLNMWCSDGSILGHGFSEVFPGFKQEGFADLLEQVWHTAVCYRATETPAYICNGSIRTKRYFDFEYKPLLDENAKTYAILHTATDVTERRNASEMVKAHKGNLSFNQDLDIISYSLSHDAKNPLTIAKMGIQQLKAKQDSGNPERQWYNLIDDAITNVESIIDKTAQLSRARVYCLQKELIHLDEKIVGWCREAKLMFRANHTDVLLGDLLPIYGDGSSIYQVFMNLINNAVKYSSTNPEAKIRVHSEKVANGILYHITDNGIGIPTNDLERIRQSYVRASNVRNFQGRGIGLFIVQKVLEKLGARMDILSKEGEGTEIKLLFP